MPNRHGRSGGGVEGEGETPEMVGMALGCPVRDDGNATFGSSDAFGFAEVVAENGVDRMADAFGFVGLEKAEGEDLGSLALRISECGMRIEGKSESGIELEKL